MTQVHRAEPVVLVPVEGEGAQGAFQTRGHVEKIGYARRPRLAQCPAGAAGPLQRAYGGLGTQRADQSALVAGEFGKRVQGVAETVRLRPDGTSTDISEDISDGNAGAPSDVPSSRGPGSGSDGPAERPRPPDPPGSSTAQTAAASSPYASANLRRARRPWPTPSSSAVHKGAVRTRLTCGGSWIQPSSSCCSLRLSA
ncbi:hypothetical protein SAV31267_063910 [Streptomyces avermitilis]|uniref:Uncharacterized protein n=1 Tax=Streptomyces avermitilis TaxID=33903 RepID=A0A4D4MYZ6_STRAX|nr:hypothetical protein SAV31267_063910 [Streptomyces avermitilis]